MLRKFTHLNAFFRGLCSAANSKTNEQVPFTSAHELQTTSDFFQRVLQRFPPGSNKNEGYSFPLAFAYGSGVFKQKGNVSRDNMTDFILVVENSECWHTANIAKNPSDYSGKPWFKAQ